MNPQELIRYYAEKKLSQELNKAEIRDELEHKHHYSKEQVSALMTEIFNYELILIQNQKSPIEKFLSSVYVSYFFILFAIGVIGYTVFKWQKDVNTPMDKVLPWIFIFGAIFLIYKHSAILYNRKKHK